MSAEAVCPVEWCVNDECHGDHWAGVDDEPWPSVEATSYSSNGRQYIAAAPTWCAIEGDAPAVLVWIQRIGDDNVAMTDESFDFTPAEARALADQLIAAADVAEATGQVIDSILQI